MTRLKTRPPNEYEGQDLCPRCGDDGGGNRYAICVDGYDCEKSCATYHYRDLCAACETALLEAHPTRKATI